MHYPYFIKKIIRRSFLRQSEKDFAEKVRLGKIVDLPEFTYVRPTSYIARYKNISDVETNFKKLSQILYTEKRTLLSIREMWNIYNWVKKTGNLSGDIAELGVYNGGSAKLIAETEKNKTIYLFDTFEGLPETDASFDGALKKGNIQGGTEADVKNYLRAYKNVRTVRGFFPASAERIKEKNFSFVHLDADIYQSTLNALRFFYPRMTPYGVIITHDYRSLEGVKKAFDFFFKDKPETIIELWDTQAMIIKSALTKK
jgi:hypothetical protein